VQFAPTLASEQHLTIVLADGGIVDITMAGQDATTLARVPDPAHSGNEQPQLSIHNKPIGETPIASSSLHVRCGDADHVGETPARLPQMPLVEPLRQAPNRFEAGDLTDALPPQSNTLIPGTAWLWRESAMFVVTPRTPGRALIVRLPAEALIARLGSIADLDRRPLSFDQGSGAICFTLLVALIAQAPLLSHEQRQTLTMAPLTQLSYGFAASRRFVPACPLIAVNYTVWMFAQRPTDAFVPACPLIAVNYSTRSVPISNAISTTINSARAPSPTVSAFQSATCTPSSLLLVRPSLSGSRFAAWRRSVANCCCVAASGVASVTSLHAGGFTISATSAGCSGNISEHRR